MSSWQDTLDYALSGQKEPPPPPQPDIPMPVPGITSAPQPGQTWTLPLPTPAPPPAPAPFIAPPTRWTSPFDRLASTTWGSAGAATLPYVTPPPLQQGSIGLPFSGEQTSGVMGQTQGDRAGSFGASMGDLGAHLNLGNAGPYTMERTAVLADKFAQDTLGIKTPGGFDLNPLDALLGGIKMLSDLAGPVLDYIPNTIRDTSLNSRVDIYRKLAVAGAREGMTGDQFMSSKGGPGNDLPPEVKAAIDADPNISQAEIDKLLDQYGRQLTYVGGVPGAAINLVGMGLLYTPELIAGGELLGAVRGIGAGAEAGSTLARGFQIAGKVATGAARIQKVALATGAGTMGLTTAMDAKARFEGDQAALDYWDSLAKTTPISNDPNVQLVTAFTANPFSPAMAALKGVKIPDFVPVFGGRTMGVLPLIHGGRILVDPILGNRLYRLYTEEDNAIAYGAQMYKVPVETMKTMIGPGKPYENIAVLENEIQNQGIKVAFRSLPQVEQATFLARYPGQSDAAEQAFMTMYGGQVAKALDDKAAIAAVWQGRNWQEADMTGPFSPATAGNLAYDYRTAVVHTKELRAATNTVVGIPNALHPEASAAIRTALDDVAGETVTNEWLNEMKIAYGGLRKTGLDLITPEMVKADAIPKSVVTQMLDRGDQRWADALAKNPIGMKTGRDPVLTPKSSPSEVADALGTKPQVFLDAMGSPTGVKDWNGLRDFVTEKYKAGPEYNPSSLTAEEVAAKSNAEVQKLAQDYVKSAMEPWLANGARSAVAMKTYRQLAPQLEVLKAAGGDAAQIAQLEKQIGRTLDDMQLARDPVVPFSQRTADLRSDIGKANRDAQLTQGAMRKVDAMNRLDQLAALDSHMTSLTEMGSQALDMVRKNRDGDWAWAGSTPPVPDKLYAALARFVTEPGTRQTARMIYQGADKINLSGAGDAQLWDMLKAFATDPQSPFLSTLTANEKRTLTAYLAKVQSTGTDETLAAMMNSKGLSRGSEASGAPGSASVQGLTGEQAVEAIGKLKDARDAILSGDTTRTLQRSAGLNVPQDYVDAAQGLQSQGVVHDPVFLTRTHPANIQALQNLIDSGPTSEAVQEILQRDPVLMGAMDKIIARRETQTGAPVSFTKYLDDVVNGKSPVAGGIAVDPLSALIPKDFVPPVPGVIEVSSPLDQAILDHTAVEHFIGDPGPVPPIEGVPVAQAERAVGAKRYTNEVYKRLNKVGVDVDSPIDPMVWDNKVGSDTLSALLWGTADHPPTTVGGILTSLREIESGRATQLGFGDGVLAEAQTAARKVLDSYLGKAEHAEFPPGVFMQGINPAAMGADIAELARSLVENGVVKADPVLGVQYGLKWAPKREFISNVLAHDPELENEFMSGYFAPFERRLGDARALQSLRSLFSRSNRAIQAENQARFAQSVIDAGGDVGLADTIWGAWRKAHEDSKSLVLVKGPLGRTYKFGDQAMYADIRNIPNNMLDEIVHGGQKGPGVLKEYFDQIGVPVPPSLAHADFSTMFREASSFTRRSLKGTPIGDQLAQLYGATAHNAAVTTAYYAFRFGMDIRFRAMNKFEAMFLYLGKAGLLPSDGPAMFGMTKDAIHANSESAVANTGYPFMGNRHDYMAKTLEKEQPGILRNLYTGMKAEDPELIRRSMEEMAQFDPELAGTVKMMGDTPKSYMKAMDNYWGSLMKSPDPEGFISAEIADAALKYPAMTEVLGKIEEACQNHLKDISQTFFGNPNRGLIERTLNNYLLYWPLSYTIKAARWEMKVLFDKAGGLQTNAGGAYLFNQAMAYHQRLMAEDPDYANFIASNKTLLFVTQMLFPLDPTHPLSWSLSPLVKDQLFGSTKAIWDIGPIYTLSHLLPQATTELYRQTGDLPIFSQVYPMLTGRARPKGKPPVAPIDQLIEPLDTSPRFGQ